MIEEAVIRSIRYRRSVETGDEHVEFYHETYEFIDTSNYSLYHYTDDAEAGPVHTNTISLAIIVAIWVIITAILLTFALAKERTIRSSALGVILFNLCANNFFYVVITVAWYIEHELNHSSWKGEALCHFRWIMSGTLENSFSFLLVLLSIERMILLLMPRIHAKSLTRLVLFCVIAGSWVLSLILATIQMYASTGGIVYHAESGVCYSKGRFAEVVMRSTLHYHLPTFCLICQTAALLFLQISSCRISRERDIDATSDSNNQVHFDPWDRYSTIIVTCITNILFIVLWFPETYFYIKGNLFVLTWDEVEAFIGCVYLMVSAKGLIVLLFNFGVKDTRNSILFRKRPQDEQELLDMEDVPTSSVV